MHTNVNLRFHIQLDVTANFLTQMQTTKRIVVAATIVSVYPVLAERQPSGSNPIDFIQLELKRIKNYEWAQE